MIFHLFLSLKFVEAQAQETSVALLGSAECSNAYVSSCRSQMQGIIQCVPPTKSSTDADQKEFLECACPSARLISDW